MIEWYVSVSIGRVEHILLEICPMDASRTLLGPAATCLLCECGRSSHERDLWFHGWSVSYFSLNSVALFLELGMFPENIIHQNNEWIHLLFQGKAYYLFSRLRRIMLDKLTFRLYYITLLHAVFKCIVVHNSLNEVYDSD